VTTRYTAETTDDTLRRIRARRQGLAGSIRQLQMELDRVHPPSTRQPQVEHEQRLLATALEAMLRPALPPAVKLSGADAEIETALRRLDEQPTCEQLLELHK
jgi:hypothetical protein